MSNLAGRVLVGRYRLIEPVGHGSQASVWSAEHLALATPVAVKLIDPELAKRPEALERFRREATAAAQLRSAHVVQILDHGVDHGPTGEEQPFIVMEMLEGEDLFSRLDKRHKLTLGETARIVTQVARALTRAHQAGIVHRDLKPENVFLVPNDDEEVVKVLDFGVAKLERATRVTMTASGAPALVGTPHYMSPEQIRGTDDVDFRTDLWAMGVIGFQCVVGDLPFDSKSIGELLLKIATGKPPVPSDVDPSVPRAFDGWFARSCDRDPSKRFDSARAQAEALLRVAELSPERPSLAPMSLAAPPPSAAPRPSFVPPPAAPPVAPAPAPAPAAPPVTTPPAAARPSVTPPPPGAARPSVTPPPPGAARSVPPPRAPSMAPPRAASVPPRAPSMAPPRAASVPPRRSRGVGAAASRPVDGAAPCPLGGHAGRGRARFGGRPTVGAPTVGAPTVGEPTTWAPTRA
jgi:serine/threonine protein kinase